MQLDGATQIYGIMGNPVSHSLSPAIHNAAFQALETIVDLPASTVLVLGAGGSARAVGFGLQEKGATVILANRTLAKGQALARDLNCECYPLEDITPLSRP